MTTQIPLDFASYSDVDLESSLFYIDEDAFPQTHAACLEEIERRMKSGGWHANPPAQHWYGSRVSRSLSTVFGVGGVGAVFFYGHNAIGAVIETAWQLPTTLAETLAVAFPLLH